MTYALQVDLGDMWHFVLSQKTLLILEFPDFDHARLFMIGVRFGAPVRIMQKGEDGRWNIAKG